MSSILDDARGKIARDIYFEGEHFEEGSVADVTWRDIPDDIRKKYLDRADQILSLSGTTDIECPTCNGHRRQGYTEGDDGELEIRPCPDCNHLGVIKHKWKIAVVLENGELPEVKEDYPFERLETQADMLNEGWVKGV